MNLDRNKWMWMKLAAGALLLASAPLSAQTPPAAPTSAILMNLTVKPGVEREQIMKVMPREVRETVQLYLDGKIQQWYSKGDGKGVVFLLNCATTEEAKTIMESLPLSKANLVNLEYTELSPLKPLQMLLGAPPKGNPER